MPRERKKSTMQLSPIAPPAEAVAASGGEQTPAQVAATPAAPKVKPLRNYYYAAQDVEDRLRAAYAAVSGVAGPYASYNDFRLAGMLQLAQQLEDELNNGEPFPRAPERFAPGRPLR